MITEPRWRRGLSTRGARADERRAGPMCTNVAQMLHKATGSAASKNIFLDAVVSAGIADAFSDYAGVSSGSWPGPGFFRRAQSRSAKRRTAVAYRSANDFVRVTI
jgi:hypothetical protein